MFNVGKYHEMGKVRKNMCENVENHIFLADPLFLQHSLYVPLDRSKNVLHVSGSQKYLFFSTKAYISGVIFIYTWHILFGTPCIYLLDLSVDVFWEIESLVRLLDKENKESITVGDTKCDLHNHNHTKNLYNHNHTKHLNTLMNNFGLTERIKEPTRITVSTQTLIDHIITNRPNFVLHGGVIHCGISDHDSIYMVKRLRMPKLKADPKFLM